MESLYTKYRPNIFAEVVGQEHVVDTLTRAVTEGRTSHAYLFCGPRGTGKTTLARILAKALLCEEGTGKLPDGTCEQCRLIAAGSHPDVHELDAASNTGVDNVREEIIGRVNFAPVMGRAKVYIIDEVHMLSKAAFNALLKTFEEPPINVTFVLCTTDPQAIPETILSRVQRFDFHAIPNEQLKAQLEYVCEQEGFTYEDEALSIVTQHARGGMRDALTTLQQLATFGSGTITALAARNLKGDTSVSQLSRTVRALAARDVPTLFGEVAQLVDGGRDLLYFTRELSARVRDIYVLNAASSATEALNADADALAELQEEAALFNSSDRLAYILSELGQASSEMRYATNQRLVLEIALTRIARPAADLTLESLADRIATLEAQATGAAARAPQPMSAPVVEQAVESPATEQMPRAVQAPRQPAIKQEAEVSPAEQQTEASAVGQVSVPPVAEQMPTTPAAQAVPTPPVAEQLAPSTAESVPTATVPADAPQTHPASTFPGQALSPSEVQRAWKEVIDRLFQTDPSRGSLLLNAIAGADDGTTLTVELPKGSTFALKMLDRQDVKTIINPIIFEVFGERQVVYVDDLEVAQTRTSSAAPQTQPATQAHTSTQAQLQTQTFTQAQTPVQTQVQEQIPVQMQPQAQALTTTQTQVQVSTTEAPVAEAPEAPVTETLEVPPGGALNTEVTENPTTDASMGEVPVTETAPTESSTERIPAQESASEESAPTTSNPNEPQQLSAQDAIEAQFGDILKDARAVFGTETRRIDTEPDTPSPSSADDASARTDNTPSESPAQDDAPDQAPASEFGSSYIDDYTDDLYDDDDYSYYDDSEED